MCDYVNNKAEEKKKSLKKQIQHGRVNFDHYIITQVAESEIT